MSASVLLRIGSAACLLSCRRSYAGRSAIVVAPPGIRRFCNRCALFGSMRMVMSRTYWDFYVGFGLIISVFLAAQAVVVVAARDRDQEASNRRQADSLLFSLSRRSRTRALMGTFFFAVPLVPCLDDCCNAWSGARDHADGAPRVMAGTWGTEGLRWENAEVDIV